MISTIHTLAMIGLKPETTPRDKLTVMKRLARQVRVRTTSIIDERMEMRRNARKLQQHLPFTKRAIEALEDEARQHRADELESANNVLRGIGYEILHDPSGELEKLSFDELADLLNINRIDREEALREGALTIWDLVFIHKLEDSASLRHLDWGGGPLFHACWLAMAEFIRTAPEGTLPDPFAPGEIFGPKLPPQLHIVSTKEANPC